MKNKELAKIVDLVLQDKENNFYLLYKAIGETVYYMSYNILKNHLDAEDAAQEIILYIYNHMEEIRVTQAFNQWMNRVIYGICNRNLSKIIKVREGTEDEELKPIVDEEVTRLPENYIISQEHREILLDIVQSLPEKQRDVILLFYYQDLTSKEIADILDCSVPAVKNRLIHAKKSLKARITESKRFHKDKLYGVGLLPVLIHLLHEESTDIYTSGAKNRIWDGVQKKMTSQHLSSSEDKNKKWSFLRKIIFLVLCLSTLSVTTYALTNYYLGIKEEHVPALEKSELDIVVENTLHDSDGNENVQRESIEVINDEEVKNLESNSEVIDENTEYTILGNEETQEIVQASQETQPEEISNSTISSPRHSKTVEFNQQTKEGKVITEGSDTQRVFNNTATIEDEEKTDVLYEVPVDGKKEGDLVFEEEHSNTTYHSVSNQILQFEKTGDREDGSIVKSGDVITYTIRVTNVGSVPVRDIIVKDTIQINTCYIKELTTVNREDIHFIKGMVDGKDTVFWIIQQLDPNESVEVQFQVSVSPVDQESEKEIRNVAYVGLLDRSGELQQELTLELLEMKLDKDKLYSTNEVIYQRDNGKKSTDLPKTGDSTNIGLFMIVFAISILIIVFLKISKRKQ